MRQQFLNVAAVAALAAGIVLGQDAPAQPAPHARAGRGAMMGRFGADLNLTEAQKQQARSIFAGSFQSSRAVDSQLKQSREALAAAVKSGASEAEIDKLTSSMAPLLAQSVAMHTKTFAKFYAILTQEQKDKIGDRMSRMMSGMGGGFGGSGRSDAAQGRRGRRSEQ